MIETHADLDAGIGVKYGVILANNPQLSDFLVRVQSGSFAGFPDHENRKSGPDMGLFYYWRARF
jgi:hypothetical protein